MNDPLVRYRIRVIPDNGGEPVFICNAHKSLDFTSLENAKRSMYRHRNQLYALSATAEIVQYRLVEDDIKGVWYFGPSCCMG